MSGVRSALIVASYKYDDPRLRLLRTPERDADALAEVLGDPAIGGFDVQTVVNQSSHDISVRVAEFFAQRSPDDVLLLHFSCHGVKDDSGELFLAATDTRMDLLEATAVSSAFVNRSMTRSRSGCVVLLLDCCYAGAFARGTTRAAADVDLTDRFGGHGRAVITASTALQFAFEGADLSSDTTIDSSPSVFTRSLVDGLRTGEADRDADGYVSLDELYAHVHDEVTRVNPDQTPQKWLFDVTGDLRLARRATPVTVPSELPAPIVESLESPVSWVRESAAEPLGTLLRGSHPGRALAAKMALDRLATEDDSHRVRQAAQAVIDAWSDPGPSTPVGGATASPETPGHAEPSSVLEQPPTRISSAPDASDTPTPVADVADAPSSPAPTDRPSSTPGRVSPAQPRQVARWCSLGALVIALLVLIALGTDMATDLQGTTTAMHDIGSARLVWFVPAVPVVVASWLVVRQRLPGVALGCLVGAWLWVVTSWLWIRWPVLPRAPTHTNRPFIVLVLLLVAIAGVIVTAPELREGVRANRLRRGLAAGVLLVGAIVLRTESFQIASQVTTGQHDFGAPFGHTAVVWLGIVLPLVIGLPATVLAFNRSQAQAFRTCGYLAIIFAGVVATASLVMVQSGQNFLNHFLYLMGSIAILLAVRVGQSPARVPTPRTRRHPSGPRPVRP